MVPVLVLWMQISSEFEIFLIAFKEFNIEIYYLQASAEMDFLTESKEFKKKSEDRGIWGGRHG